MRKEFAVLSVLVLFFAKAFAQKDYSQISPQQLRRLRRMSMTTILTERLTAATIHVYLR